MTTLRTIRTIRTVTILAMLGIGGGAMFELNTSNAPKAQAAPVANTVHDPDPMPRKVAVTTTTTSTTVAPHVASARSTRSYNRNASLNAIAQCESGGSYTAQNRHSTASGKYQVLDSTWGGYAGYARAKDAPPDVQEAQAAEMYARSGSAPWAASRGCWG